MSQMEQVVGALEEAIAGRKNGALDERAFYTRLLELHASLIQVLQAELADRQALMAAHDVRKQIPLILVMLEEQIDLYRRRQE